MRKGILIAIFIVGCARAQDFPRGQITEKVFCSADSGETYSLYLPSNYDPTTPWPIIYCFEPGARAMMPTSLYYKIMEQHSFIFVCSWVSRNGPWQTNIDALHAMWKDTHKRFNIDPKRVYATGFSGGSRTATELGMRYPNQVTGIIGIGAGFSQLQDIPMQIPFIYYGIAGYEDFNHSEMTYLDDLLEQRRVTHRIAYFDGNHQWAPSEDFQLGMEWMEIQAIRNGIKPKDQSWIEKLFGERKSFLAKLLADGKTYDATVWVNRMQMDFQDFLDVRQEANLYDSLKNTKAYKKWTDRAKSIHSKEVEFQDAFDAVQYTMVGPVFDADEDPNLKKVLQTIGDWVGRVESKDVLERQAAARCLFYVNQYGKIKGNQFITAGEWKRAAVSYDLASKAYPNDSLAFYNLSCALARSGEVGKAVKALEKAVKYGYRDLASIQSDEDLVAIRNDKGYQKIINNLSEKR